MVKPVTKGRKDGLRYNYDEKTGRRIPNKAPKKEVVKTAKDRMKELRAKIEKGRSLAKANPDVDLLAPTVMKDYDPDASMDYKPWIRPRKAGAPLCIFDNPPPMSNPAREIFDDLSQRIPDPNALGLTPDKIMPFLQYCYMQAWLIQQHLETISAEWEKWSEKLNHRVNYPNPQFNQWFVAHRNVMRLHSFLFDKALSERGQPRRPPLPDPDENDPPPPEVEQFVTVKDFPSGMRQAAIAASESQVDEEDLTDIMPYAVRIGDKRGG